MTHGSPSLSSKPRAASRSYREGEPLAGFNDAFIQEINKDNVVVNYEGATQVLALNKPDYFKGAWRAARLQNDERCWRRECAS